MNVITISTARSCLVPDHFLGFNVDLFGDRPDKTDQLPRHGHHHLVGMLGARGIGSAWTTLHTVYYAQEVATLLEIPEDIQQVVLLPVAYYTGEDFKPAKRVPAGERTYWDTWGQTR